jgi:phosphoribosyl-AMP cyclohydrolase / phosphoribosyl-ATP pyrophosphohydrolase
MSASIPGDLVTNEAGLVPVIVQDRASGDVLMVAWSNAEALAHTAATGFATFWSRSRRALWRKGETSGHGMRVVEARTDCDRDVLLLVVEPQGPACHTNARTCFGEDSPTAAGMLEELVRVVADRAQTQPAGSYTARLLATQGQALAKIGEEAAELVAAARTESDERVAAEAADLLYHLVVALHERRVPLTRVMDELRRRRSAR